MSEEYPNPYRNLCLKPSPGELSHNVIIMLYRLEAWRLTSALVNRLYVFL